MSYESPVKVIFDYVQTETEEEIIKAIQNVGIEVNTFELRKALMYDRRQYTQGFEDGKKFAEQEFEKKKKKMFNKVCELFAEDADWICDELNDDDEEREICNKTCKYRCCQPQCVERYVRRILKMDEVTE